MNDLFITIQPLVESTLLLFELPKLPHLAALKHFPALIFSNTLWGAASFVCVELTRDIYHWIGHRWKFLRPQHMKHHTAYKTGFVVRWKYYYASLTEYEIPEAILMVLVAGTFEGLALTLPAMEDAIIGCSFSLLQATLELAIKVLRWRGVKWAMAQDTTHVSGPLIEPPSIWRVNLAYHFRHHFGDPDAYISGKFTLFDKLSKLAISLKGRTVGFISHLDDLDQPLKQALQQAGAKVLPPEPATALDSTDILVIDISRVKNLCPQDTTAQMEAFLDTVRTNRDVTTKEIWLMVSDVEGAIAWTSLDDLYQRYLSDWITRRRLDAPCILRKIVVGAAGDRTLPPPTIARRIVGAVQRDMRNIVVRSPRPTHVLQPLREWVVSNYFRVNH